MNVAKSPETERKKDILDNVYVRTHVYIARFLCVRTEFSRRSCWFKFACVQVSSYRVCSLHFYSASALLAMQSAVLARWIPSVRPSFRHVLVFCPDQ